MCPPNSLSNLRHLRYMLDLADHSFGKNRFIGLSAVVVSHNSCAILHVFPGTWSWIPPPKICILGSMVSALASRFSIIRPTP